MTEESPRRRTILEAASRLFEHYGHAKTTMADVAREAGIGVGTVYLEFDSKEAIVGSLSDKVHVRVLSAMRAAMPYDDDHARRLSAALIARTQAFVELHAKGQHACDLLHCRSDAVRVAHERFKASERSLLREILDAGMTTGAFRQMDTSRVAAVIQRAFLSLTPPWVGDLESEAVQTAAELSTMLLLGIVALPASGAGPRGGRRERPSATRGRAASKR